MPLRITPACAGKTRACRPACMAKEDHPRLCGENYPRGRQVCPIGGSPPPVRGKRVIHKLKHGGNRITPACAGKTLTYNGNNAEL